MWYAPGLVILRGEDLMSWYRWLSSLTLGSVKQHYTQTQTHTNKTLPGVVWHCYVGQVLQVVTISCMCSVIHPQCWKLSSQLQWMRVNFIGFGLLTPSLTRFLFIQQWNLVSSSLCSRLQWNLRSSPLCGPCYSRTICCESVNRFMYVKLFFKK